MLTKTDLNQISKIIKSENNSLGKEINKKFKKVEMKLDKAINFLDRDHIRLLERVDRIEEHLQLTPIS